ncbi:MAG: hypothetical protein V4614_06395 [Pseudomonadota bacterium]
MTNLSIQLGFLILLSIPIAVIGLFGGLAINANRRWVRKQFLARVDQQEIN